MRINVRVSPGSKNPSVRKKDGVYHVRVRSLPIKGRANREVIASLAEYFGTAKSNVSILRGVASQTKLVEILGH